MTIAPFGGRNERHSLAAVFLEFGTRRRVSGRDILKVVLSQNLVDILFLVYFLCLRAFAPRACPNTRSTGLHGSFERFLRSEP
jgi:hypothetical protein